MSSHSGSGGMSDATINLDVSFARRSNGLVLRAVSRFTAIRDRIGGKAVLLFELAGTRQCGFELLGRERFQQHFDAFGPIRDRFGLRIAGDDEGGDGRDRIRAPGAGIRCRKDAASHNR